MKWRWKRRQRDWVQWNKKYDDPDFRHNRRLAVVQRFLTTAIDEHRGPVSILSMCAGQGRDVIGVLSTHDRAHEVNAVLVEADPAVAAAATQAAKRAGLTRVDVRVADAGVSDTYAGLAPADIVLACGVFGNISDDDVHSTIASLPQLCAPAATVIWTRTRRPPDRTPITERWLAEAGFDAVAAERPEDAVFHVGVGRLRRPPDELSPGARWFTFGK